MIDQSSDLPQAPVKHHPTTLETPTLDTTTTPDIPERGREGGIRLPCTKNAERPFPIWFFYQMVFWYCFILPMNANGSHTIHIPKRLHRELKLEAVRQGISLKELVQKLLADSIGLDADD